MRTYQSESIAKLSEALSKAQGEMSHAHKSADNPFFKSKYADLPSVIDAARGHLSKHGISVTQFTDFDENGITLITQLNYNGEWIRGYYPVKPVKADPQGFGSALTYARRYAYQSLVGIASSSDDDDGNAASGNTKPMSAAAQRREADAFMARARSCESPSKFLQENRSEIIRIRDDSPEPDLTMISLVKELTTPFNILLESSDDPAELCGVESTFIETCKKYYPLGHTELLAAVKRRKEHQDYRERA